MTLHKRFRLEFVAVVSDIARSNVRSYMEGVSTILKHCDQYAHEHCDNKVAWEDRLWNEEDQVWEFLICYSCLGPTSAQCAEHGGSCLNGDAAP